MVRLVTSCSAASRLAAARRFVLDAPPASQLLIVSASRGAADDFARDLARSRAATFGLYRFSLTQLAARLAAPRLAAARLSPATPLGIQAVAARALFDAVTDKSLTYFAPVAATPGFPRALARTLEELALAAVPAGGVASAPEVGGDLADLFERFDAQFQHASAVDRAAFLRAATDAAADTARAAHPYASCRLLLLDIGVDNAAERAFVGAIVARAPDTLVTIPAGDAATRCRRWPIPYRSTATARLGSIAFAAICSPRRRRRRPIRSTMWSCSRRRARGASRSKSRGACCARRAAEYRSTGWRLRCARRSSTPGFSSTRSNARAFRSTSIAAHGVRIRRGVRFSR
jgi:hypothetical protein